MTVAAAAGDAPGSRNPRRDWSRGDGPPRHDGPPKRARETEIDVVTRIETVTADGGPPKRHLSSRGGSDAGDGSRMARAPSGSVARGGMRGGSYDEPPQDAGAVRRRAPSRWESAAPGPPDGGGARREHPAEALRRTQDEVRSHGDRPGAPPLPGPPPPGPPSRSGAQNGGGMPAVAPPPAPTVEEGGPNFGLSGVLAADSKRNQRGTVQKYAPPDDSCMPLSRWRIYIYKGAMTWCAVFCALVPGSLPYSL